MDGLQAGAVVAGRYRVERCLGQGGMGAVYLVRHVRTDERLALKILHASVLAHAEAVERFRREARAPAQVDSDHVARVVDADVAPEIGGAPFLVMEYLRGRDLETEVAARGRLPPGDVVSYLGQAARALDKAHAIGIVHRDLKPENLFLAEREDGSVCLKVVDFGIARLATPDGPPNLTATGAMFGTPRYMAPEQARGDTRGIGPATDVWALGLIAFKLLTGEDFWVFETLPELLVKLIAEPIPLPSARGAMFGPDFDAWFSRCCARAPVERFQSAGEAVAALAAALGTSAPVTSGVRAATAPTAAFSATAVASTAFGSPPSGAFAPTHALAPTAAALPIAAPLPVVAPPPVVAPAPPEGPSGALIAAIAGGALLGLGVLAVAGVLAFRALSGPDPVTPGPEPKPRPATPADEARCKALCTRLNDCTHIVDPKCESNCRSSPSFMACARPDSSCNAISNCALAAYCGGQGPAGTKSCKATANCEGACNMAGGDNTACMCACIRAMASDRATELMINNQCGAVHCAEACRKPVNGIACMACFNASCLADAQVCQKR